MKTNKLVGRLAIPGIVICMLSGCSETLYREISYPSLVQAAELQSDKVYKLKDIFPASKMLSGIEIDTWLLNIRTMRDYNTSFVIPYKTWVPTKPGEYGMGKIGQKPFVIDLFLRADGDGASFDPVLTELYINRNDKPVYPAGIFNSGRFVQCGEHNGVVAATNMQIKRGVILPLANKFDVEKGKRGLKMYWTCIQLRFDVPTPDPSERFRLKLGEITTPKGEHIRPTIYFSPVTYKEFVH